MKRCLEILRFFAICNSAPPQNPSWLLKRAVPEALVDNCIHGISRYLSIFRGFSLHNLA